MDKLKILRKVKQHAARMPKRSKTMIDGASCCAYRTRNGNKCFIGALIPDRLYKQEFEGNNVSDLPKEILEYIGVSGPDDVSFLIQLQLIHDREDSLVAGKIRTIANVREDLDKFIKETKKELKK